MVDAVCGAGEGTGGCGEDGGHVHGRGVPALMECSRRDLVWSAHVIDPPLVVIRCPSWLRWVRHEVEAIDGVEWLAEVVEEDWRR